MSATRGPWLQIAHAAEPQRVALERWLLLRRVQDELQTEPLKAYCAELYRQALDPPRAWATRIKVVYDNGNLKARLRYEAWIAGVVLKQALDSAQHLSSPLRPRMRLSKYGGRFLCIAPLQLRSERRPVWLAWHIDADGLDRGLTVLKEDVTPELQEKKGEREWLEKFTAGLEHGLQRERSGRVVALVLSAVQAALAAD